MKYQNQCSRNRSKPSRLDYHRLEDRRLLATTLQWVDLAGHLLDKRFEIPNDTVVVAELVSNEMLLNEIQVGVFEDDTVTFDDPIGTIDLENNFDGTWSGEWRTTYVGDGLAGVAEFVFATDGGTLQSENRISVIEGNAWHVQHETDIEILTTTSVVEADIAPAQIPAGLHLSQVAFEIDLQGTVQDAFDIVMVGPHGWIESTHIDPQQQFADPLVEVFRTAGCLTSCVGSDFDSQFLSDSLAEGFTDSWGIFAANLGAGDEVQVQLRTTLTYFSSLDVTGDGNLPVPLSQRDYGYIANPQGDEITETAHGTTNAVILIHGWNPRNLDFKGHYGGDGPQPESGFWNNMEESIEFFADSQNWLFGEYDWVNDAATGGTGLFGTELVANLARQPLASRDVGVAHGAFLGRRLFGHGEDSLFDSLESVQLIAHSAGNWVAMEAAAYLRAAGFSGSLQVTSLDAFVPDRDTIYSFGFEIEVGVDTAAVFQSYSSFFGLNDTLDNYYVRDFRTDPEIISPPQLVASLLWTSGDYAPWNINRKLDELFNNAPFYESGPFHEHNGPVGWYAFTANFLSLGGRIDDLVENSVPLGFGSSLLYKDWILENSVAAIGTENNVPFQIAEGGTLRLDASASQVPFENTEFLWDLDGDNQYGEIGSGALRGNETGVSPLLFAAGFDNGIPSQQTGFDIGLKVQVDGELLDAAGQFVTVINTPPFAGISGPNQVSANQTVTYTAINYYDPSDHDNLLLDPDDFTWIATGLGISFSGSGEHFTFTPTVSTKFDVKLTIEDVDEGQREIVKVINLDTDNAETVLNEILARTLEGNSDHDVFQVQGSIDQELTLGAYFDDVSSGLFTSGRVRLLDSNSNVLVALNNQANGNHRYSLLNDYVLPADGTYFVEVYHSNHSGGNYWLGIADPVPSYQPLSLTELTTAQFGVLGDVQEYEFEAVAGQPLAWTYQGRSINEWRIVDPGGNVVQAGDGELVTTRTFSINPGQTGTYRLIFEDSNVGSLTSPASIGPFNYTLTPIALTTEFSDSVTVVNGNQVIRDRRVTLNLSDDAYLRVLADEDVKGPPVLVELEGTVPLNDPAFLGFQFEAASNTPNVVQTIEAFNFASGAYEIADSRDATINDSVVVVSLTGDLSRFVGANGEVRMRVGWEPDGPVLFHPWQVRIDQAVWLTEPAGPSPIVVPPGFDACGRSAMAGSLTDVAGYHDPDAATSLTDITGYHDPDAGTSLTDIAGYYDPGAGTSLTDMSGYRDLTAVMSLTYVSGYHYDSDMAIASNYLDFSKHSPRKLADRTGLAGAVVAGEKRVDIDRLFEKYDSAFESEFPGEVELDDLFELVALNDQA